MLWASIAGIVAAIGLGLATPAHAASGDAEKLRRLDIMLMVTGLRCRTTPDAFTDDYGNFSRKHLSELNAANRELREDLAKRHGAKGAVRALDRMSVVMANEYGGGHPWLSCSELREVARNLSTVQGRETLVEAADQLLAGKRGPVFALASR
ncbi:hypothetical protein GCM10011494_00320 [Novosphingobium endophyticum]|uniref:S-adenosyl-L-homocysteine hydrolase n=1 Tax=Novosphingobium endophyticum TaxID=1955250 RepID=A0A916TP84_9SPHN|nr:S-adenosyl-L-homocysteine hydrolase [Novosphingobium endophyticum]GGB85984.1 hypothetical protein GCM10011494_00320 [Novosphingobium endophyticum]